MPSRETMSVFFPSMVTWPVTLLRDGLISATSFDQIGAARHMSTRTTKSAPNASAVLLRFSRRSARRHGPRPGSTFALPSTSAWKAAGTSETTSVPGSMPMVASEQSRAGPAVGRPRPGSAQRGYLRHQLE